MSNNPLLSRLAALRRWVRVLEGWQGICALATVLLGAIVVAGLLDWTVQLPSFMRGVLLAAIVAASGLVAYRYLFLPWTAPADDLTLALRIEEEFPELNDSLGSTVQFLNEPADSPGAASSSEAMRKKAVQQMMARSDQYDFSRIVSYRPALILSVCLLAVLAIAGHFAYRHTQFAMIALARLADPFGGHTWTTVDVPNAPTKLAQGQGYAVKATLVGMIPEHAKVELKMPRAEGAEGAEEAKPEEWDVRVQKDAESGSVFLPVDKTKYTKTFEFRVVANDGSFPRRPGQWHQVQVLPPPSLVDLNGLPSPQVEVHPPEYTGEQSPQKLAPGTKMIRAWAGSGIVFRAATNREVATVWFEYRPRAVAHAPVPAYRGAALIGTLASRSPLAVLGELFSGQTMWERVPAEIDSGGRTFTVRLSAWNPGTCILHLEDEDHLPKEYSYELDVDIDPLPNVKLLQPASALTLLPDAEVTLRFQADDDIFGLRSIFAEYRRTGPELPLTAAERAVLALTKGYERDFSRIEGPLVQPKGDEIEPLVGKPRQIGALSRWKLANRFKVGEVVTLRIAADDYCNVYGKRLPGYSHEVQLQIVSKAELTKAIDDKLKGFQQDIKKIENMEKEARDIVKDVEKKDKITAKDVERLVEAEQKQKEIRDLVGSTPEDGLRKELDKLQQLLKDNKMKDSEAQMRTGMIKGALDQLARQELDQIEPMLSQARKEAAAQAGKDNKGAKGEKDKGGKQPDKKNSALDKTAKLQENALQNLAELAKALEPWADLQEVKDEVRGVLDQQTTIKQNLDKVKNAKEELDKAELRKTPREKEEVDRQLRDELNKEAGNLDELAKRAEELQAKIDRMLANRQKKDDKDSADKLKAAKKIGEKAALPAKMKDTSNELKETASGAKDPVPSNRAQQQQKQNIDNLEKMLAALEGKDDNADQLKLKKNRQAQEKLDKFAKEQKELDKKLDEINKLKDNEERLNRRKELAEEAGRLQQEAQEQARELARLQEQQASKKMEQAAEELGKAKDKLQNGQDPGEEQQAAKQDAAKAKKALEESQEELAREQLAKIADRLKALEERQAAAVDRTKDFHRKLMLRKNWTSALGKSLDGDANSQEGLAREVRSLKEKIKEAKVFEHIMERSAKSMDEAVQVMKARRDEGIAVRQRDPKMDQPWDKDDIKAENESNVETLRHQTQADQRLKHLLDAVKEELAKKQEKKDDEAKNDQGGPEQKGGLKAQDGIPSVAQLKALRAEQIDLNERTEEFAKRNPMTDKLPEPQRRELEQIQQDQRSLQELFRQITANNNAEKKGDAP
jgi:hypothetical protein